MNDHVRRTKIVATIGPSSSSPDVLATLVAAGMNGARFNFSHGTLKDFAENWAAAAVAQDDAGHPIAVIVDLQGPKLRIGDLTSAGLARPGAMRS